jgi:hypothetical protein
MVKVELCQDCLRRLTSERLESHWLCTRCQDQVHSALTGKPRRGFLASYVRFWFTPYIWILKALGALEEILKWYREGASTS